MSVLSGAVPPQLRDGMAWPPVVNAGRELGGEDDDNIPWADGVEAVNEPDQRPVHEAGAVEAVAEEHAQGQGVMDMEARRAEEARRRKKALLFLSDPVIMNAVSILFAALGPERRLMRDLLSQQHVNWSLKRERDRREGQCSSHIQQLLDSGGPLRRMLEDCTLLLRSDSSVNLANIQHTSENARLLFSCVARSAACVFETVVQETQAYPWKLFRLIRTPVGRTVPFGRTTLSSGPHHAPLD